MSEQLLVTKLYVPKPRADLVTRPRLVEQLNEGLDGKLILISPPAGFGKTTLLSEWANNADIPVPWVSLDAADNDLARFLTYCVAALQSLRPGIGEATLGALQAPQPPAIDALLTSLINEIGERLDSFALVLDDYHFIEAQPVHAALTFLLENLPPQMHVVVAGRADPPLPLARLRAQRQLNEIRAADLRFTVDEAAALLSRTIGLPVSPDAVAVLEARTEGWAAGLQLAAISMRGCEDISGFVEAFTGSHRFVIDYLVEEVLSQQPQELQDFLLATAVLERLNAPLCEAVTGEHESQVILTRLEQANLFLVPLDDERRWYRYHHLFADLLRHRLGQSHRDRLRELHHRASVWYENNDLPEEAIHHAISGENFRRAAWLTEVNGMKWIARSDLGTLRRWIEALPKEWVRTRARLGTLYGWALTLTNQLDQVEPYLHAAEESIRAALREPELFEEWDVDDPERFVAECRGYVATCRAALARQKGDGRRMVEYLHQALAHFPEDEPAGRSVAYLYMGFALWMAGDVPGARRNFEEASHAGQAGGQVYVALSAMGALGRLLNGLGELREAERMYWQAFGLAKNHTNQTRRPLPAIAVAHCGMTLLSYEWNDLAEATAHVTRAIEMVKPLGVTEYLLNSYVALARLQYVRGEIAEALDTMETAALLVEAPQVSALLRAEVSAHRARLWITLKDEQPNHLVAASRWASEAGLRATDDPISSRELEYLTLVRLILARGAPGDAIGLLDRMHETAEPAGRKGRVIEILVLKALSHYGHGHVSQALASLERALDLAEPEGYVRTFVDEGEPMRTLLRQLAGRGIRYAYAQKLLAAFDGASGVETAVPTQARTHRLTPREVEVLRLISAGLTNQEIANQLVISVVTAKRHISNLYDKLGVTNRTMAAARAHELSLL